MLRNKTVLLGGGLVIVVLAAAALALFQPWKLFVHNTVNESAPAAVTSPTAGAASAGPSQVLYETTSWKAYEHPTSGTVRVYRFADGRQTLRLENFSTSNGPDVKVWLSKQSYDSDDFKTGYLNLGTLKGDKGSSNYAVPAGTDLSQYKSVVIWCKRFSVAFGAAPLRV